MNLQTLASLMAKHYVPKNGTQTYKMIIPCGDKGQVKRNINSQIAKP